jgi:hypothetical protein
MIFREREHGADVAGFNQSGRCAFGAAMEIRAPQASQTLGGVGKVAIGVVTVARDQRPGAGEAVLAVHEIGQTFPRNTTLVSSRTRTSSGSSSSPSWKVSTAKPDRQLTGLSSV